MPRPQHGGKVLLVTECSMADNVAASARDVEFVRPCNLCPHMKRITLPKILDSLLNLEHQVEIPEELAIRARRSVERMVNLSSNATCHPRRGAGRGRGSICNRNMDSRPRILRAGMTAGRKQCPPFSLSVVALRGCSRRWKLAPLPCTVLTLCAGVGSLLCLGARRRRGCHWRGRLIESHVQDTLVAGAGLCDEAMVRLMVSEASDRILDLLEYGVPFDRDLQGKLVQSREAATPTIAWCACVATWGQEDHGSVDRRSAPHALIPRDRRR